MASCLVRTMARRVTPETQIRKGALELLLLGLLRQGPRYGLQLLTELDDNGLRVTEGTLYPLLHRMKSDGKVTSEWVESNSGHPRKYYHLTAAGQRQFDVLLTTWREFVTAASRILEE